MLYRATTTLLGPAIGLYLRHRLSRGREDPERIRERLGQPGRDRPDGPLAWIHAASVGEAVSVLPLIEGMLNRGENLWLLLTTGTVTSARIMTDRLPARALHQYVPVDRPSAVRCFLDHWRPDLAIWVESELWPNLIGETRARGIPMALVNARMSETSYRQWRRLPFLIRPLLRAFDICIAQSAPDAGRLATLGARNVACHGNLKASSPPLAADARDLHELTTAIGRRPRWLAASTHPGEEAAVAAAHQQLSSRFPGLLTVVVPRHANRGDEIARQLRGLGLNVAQRSREQPIAADTEIYLGDSMGEMGLYYRLAPIVFVGGSLIEHGGQNPLEAARLDSALLFGPHMFNFTDQAAALTSQGCATTVERPEALAEAVAALLSDADETARQAAAAARVADDGRGVVDAVLEQLTPLLRQVEAERAGA
ncbi:MAG: 3-deoxy-D-manno-octulosonic acid transferase [Alphaproteobacteria bacterium]|jgi:3-deoxy-D-manno-octulosonic-acid transferase|nr:3-deoxy-D-manno-octulosonic acid transferase [Alphaproteobacteria bacterium]MDP6563676.1 3-deoxy-D-manno-octulosonic acid transferase [Alphaproteobacteria bacterium]MDP6814913.1 3-deoxy-D-manno-octulosonic acid transferase [Alphaproteobacteria bacterium]